MHSPHLYTTIGKIMGSTVIFLARSNPCIAQRGLCRDAYFSDVNKDWTHKDKDKDQTLKDQDKDKD